MPYQKLPCPHPLIERVYSSRRLPAPDGTERPFNVCIPRDEGDFLYALVRQHKPPVTVEIGLANGLSALFIAAAHEDNGAGLHIAIDPFQASEWKNAGVGLLQSAGLAHRLRLVELPSHQAIPDLEREGIRAGLVFIDGAHLTDYAMADALCSDRILEVGGLLVFDDSDWPAVQSVIRYFLANRHYAPAFPEVVIEEPPGRSSLPSRFLRSIARRVPWLGSKLSGDFMNPSRELGILGRCVALRKLADDNRDSQNIRAHRAY